MTIKRQPNVDHTAPVANFPRLVILVSVLVLVQVVFAANEPRLC
jgi:hypothetical protein